MKRKNPYDMLKNNSNNNKKNKSLNQSTIKIIKNYLSLEHQKQYPFGKRLCRPSRRKDEIQTAPDRCQPSAKRQCIPPAYSNPARHRRQETGCIHRSLYPSPHFLRRIRLHSLDGSP